MLMESGKWIMDFIKMHGAGNDYIFLDCRSAPVEDPSSLSAALSDRHFGVGGDGLVLIGESASCFCRMDMYNADGSRGEMCGNALRCVAKYLYGRGEIPAGVQISVETLAGTRSVVVNAPGGVFRSVTADMGEPVLSPPDIPFLFSTPRVVEYPLMAGEESLFVTALSMGNPHAVVFCGDVSKAPLSTLGPLLERHPAFPNRTNVEFVSALPDGSLAMRVHERGSGETLACGTGACAALVASVLAGKRASPEAEVRAKGGVLSVRWDRESNHVFLTGPAAAVFQGTLINKTKE